MNTKLFFFLGFFASALVFGQTGGLLTVRGTRIAQGELKIGEPLTARDGQQLSAGVYRIAVELNSHGEAQFVLFPYGSDQNPAGTGTVLSKHTLTPTNETSEEIRIQAAVIKNSLVKGIASKIEGEFTLQSIAPTEMLLGFDSKQFAANATLGRSLNSKLVDLLPTFLSFDQPTECGVKCIEGFVKVTVRNDGNLDAKGKWNVVLLDPRFFVGAVTDVPASGETVVTSATKLRLPCCAPLTLTVDVHADFYNKDGIDSNDENNTKKFSISLKE